MLLQKSLISFTMYCYFQASGLIIGLVVLCYHAAHKSTRKQEEFYR